MYETRCTKTNTRCPVLESYELLAAGRELFAPNKLVARGSWLAASSLYWLRRLFTGLASAALMAW
jgi:hypothetical protein